MTSLGQRQMTRGGALGSTLLIIVLLFIFGLTLANLATFDLRIVNRAGERRNAFQAAEAGLNHVIAQIGRDPKIGTNEEVFSQTLSDGSSYRVTFKPDAGDLWSLNNLAGLDGKSRGVSRKVPSNHALIVCEGASRGGEKAVVESLIRLEALPYAVAGTGRIDASRLSVFGAATGEEAQAARASGQTPEVGHTYSGSSASNSTILTSSFVSGDVRSVGGAITTGTAVAGEVKTEQDPDQLPDFKIEDFSTLLTPNVDRRPGGLQVNPVLGPGPVYIDGSATFPLTATLVNATVYVNGDFQATSLLGVGTLFVNGKTTIPVGVNLSGLTDRITVFSEKDITVGGLAGVFQGVFLTHGSFKSTGALVVLGAIYANSPATANAGNVTLGLLSVVVHVEQYTAFASYWLALGGEAEPLQVYWNQLR